MYIRIYTCGTLVCICVCVCVCVFVCVCVCVCSYSDYSVRHTPSISLNDDLNSSLLVFSGSLTNDYIYTYNRKGMCKYHTHSTCDSKNIYCVKFMF